ncbi:MAG: alpha/beta hydrolase [Chthoniobacterales bacterium]|nr:alpha/beta hydrolase [Chthoniobacterales bacterium]
MQTIPLWEGPVPHAKGTADRDIPTLDIYEPFGSRFSDAAILILPGGGYEKLSAQEGEGFAGFFQLHGFKSFVLNYRLGSSGYRHPAMLADVTRAMRLVRSRAAADGFRPDKIILIGSSAGGHLAATLLTKWDAGNPNDPDPVERVSSRPDLGVLCYPVITMRTATHGGSRANLLGQTPSAALQAELSAEEHVAATTPPCFVWHTWEDPSVPVDNALLFVGALQKVGVPFELHIYQDGGHGLGMKDGTFWQEDCLRWLKRRLKTP